MSFRISHALQVVRTKLPCRRRRGRRSRGRRYRRSFRQLFFTALMLFSLHSSGFASTRPASLKGGFARRAFHLPGIWLHAMVSASMVVLADALFYDLGIAAIVGALFAAHHVVHDDDMRQGRQRGWRAGGGLLRRNGLPARRPHTPAFGRDTFRLQR